MLRHGRILFLLVLAGCASGRTVVLPGSAFADSTPEAVVGYAFRGQAGPLAAALEAGGDPNAVAEMEEEGGDVLSALMAAAARGRVETVRVLLDADADLNATDASGRTALHWAAMRHATDAASLLLERGASAEALDDGGTSPLGWAAISNAAEVVSVLLGAGAAINASGDNGATALHLAIKTYGESYGGARTVAYLLSQGADPNAVEADGDTPLHRAASDTPGAFVVSRLLLDAGADPSVRNARGQTPADLAVQRNAVQLAALYADEPSAVTQADLAASILNGDARGIEAALATGADANAGVQDNSFFAAQFIDDGGPVHLAAHIGAAPAVIAALKAGGADLDAVTSAGNPPMKVAAERGDVLTVQSLLASGASPESTTARPFLGMEPIHWAATGGHADVVESLIEAGADPNYTTNASMGYGYNALGFAIHHGHYYTTLALLGAGMDTGHVGETPQTALDLAETRGWTEIADLLRARGAQTGREVAVGRVEEELRQFTPAEVWEHRINDGDPDAIRAMLARGLSAPRDLLPTDIVYGLGDDPDLIALLVASGADVNARAPGGYTALHLAAGDGLAPLVAALLDAGAGPLLEDEDGKTAVDWALAGDHDETVAMFTVGPE